MVATYSQQRQLTLSATFPILPTPPFEQRRPRFDHGMYCSLSDSFTEFLQYNPFLMSRQNQARGARDYSRAT